MASKKYEDRYHGDRDVQVHLTAGCDLCGRTDKHTHTQPDWRELIDKVGKEMEL